jgi:hypothetical protein
MTEERNLNELNPKLNPGDRIVLVYMDDYVSAVPIGSIGIIDSNPKTYKINQPKFKKEDCGYGYSVEWFDKDEETGELKFISKLPLLPDADAWIFDRDFYENKQIEETYTFIRKKDIY